MPSLSRMIFEYPIITCLVILLIALAFRLVDIFMLKLDERLGEILLSKTLGFLLVFLFVIYTGLGLKGIGFHTEFIVRSLFIGASITIIALLLGYMSEYLTMALRGVNPRISIEAIDPKASITGGYLFSIWLIVGNLINSFMEEGLFRGLMIILFTVNLPFFQANLLQALLFGGWHLPWVIKGLKIGQFKNSGEVILGTVSNFLPQFFMGAVWGYLYYRTNSLWAPIISHTLTNTALNFIHVKTDDGINNGIAIRMGVYVIVMLFGVFYINKISSWWNLKYLKINVR